MGPFDLRSREKLGGIIARGAPRLVFKVIVNIEIF